MIFYRLNFFFFFFKQKFEVLKLFILLLRKNCFKKLFLRKKLLIINAITCWAHSFRNLYNRTYIISFMITKERFAIVANQEFSAVLHETLFNYFPRSTVICFHRWVTYASVKLFHLAGRLLIFFFLHHQEWKYRGREKCFSMDETTDRVAGRRAKWENMNESAWYKFMWGSDICCSIRVLVKNGQVIYSLTRWVAAQLIPRWSASKSRLAIFFPRAVIYRVKRYRGRRYIKRSGAHFC